MTMPEEPTSPRDASTDPHGAEIDEGIDDLTDESTEQLLTPRQEIEKLLEEDQSRLGDVYRLYVMEGLSPQTVADRYSPSDSRVTAIFPTRRHGSAA